MAKPKVKLFREPDTRFPYAGMSADEIQDWRERAAAVGQTDFDKREIADACYIIIAKESEARADVVAGEIVRGLGLDRCRDLAALTEVDDWIAVGLLIRNRIMTADDRPSEGFASVE